MSRSATLTDMECSLSRCFAMTLLAVVGLTGAARAATVTAAPGDDVEQIIRALRPGDELILADGLYTMTSSLAPPYGRFSFDIAGTSTAPIVIRAAESARPHFLRGNADENLWDIRAEHVTIRGLIFSGGSIGLRIESGRDLSIEDCEIYGTRGSGIRGSLPGSTFERIRVLRNVVHGTGQGGIVFGCEGDVCRLADSEIALNHVHHLVGEAIVVREGGFNNALVDNVVHDATGTCVLTLGATGNGPRQRIEGNLLFRCGEHGIQASADALIANNIILSSGVDGLVMRPFTSVDPTKSSTPTNLVVLHNTILKTNGYPVVIDGMTPTGTVAVANNALYALNEAPILFLGTNDLFTLRGNVGAGRSVPGDGVALGELAEDFWGASYLGAPPMDVFPRTDGALVAAGDPAFVVERDFNGTARNGVADVGAYAFDPNGNPGWVLAAVMKGREAPPEPDGGSADGGEVDSSSEDASSEVDGALDGDASSEDGGTGADVGDEDAALSDAEGADGSTAGDDAEGGSSDALGSFDSGAGPADGGPSSGPDGGSGPEPDQEGGCSCRQAATPSGWFGVAALGLVVALLFGRGRRTHRR